jgi:hypothetical protein
MSTSKLNDSNNLSVALILSTGQCAFGTIRSLKDDADLKPLLGEYDFLTSTQILGSDKNIYTFGSFAVNGKVKVHYMGRKLTQRPEKNMIN